MPTISNLDDLLRLLGSVATADDPVAALEQRGHHVRSALKTRLQHSALKCNIGLRALTTEGRGYGFGKRTSPARSRETCEGEVWSK